MARSVELLLRETIKKLGRVGDVVSVAPGYANNFLLPKRLAVPATEENKRQLARRAARMLVEEEKQMAEINAKVAVLSKLVVKTKEKSDAKGGLFGSVSAARIAELVTAAGTQITEKNVRLEGPLKTVGEHKVRLHVFGDAEAEITCVIESDTPVTIVAEPEPAPEAAEPTAEAGEASAEASEAPSTEG